MSPESSDAPTPKPPVKSGWGMFVIAIASILGAFYNYGQFPDLSGVDLARSHGGCFLLASLAFVLSIITIIRIVIRVFFRQEPHFFRDVVQVIGAVVLLAAAGFLFSKSYYIFFA